MKKTFLLITLINLKVVACDICGSYMGITAYDNQSQLGLIHRYRVFNGYRSYQQRSAFFVAGAYKTAHDPNGTPGDSLIEIKNYSTKDYESYKITELRGKYFLQSRCELNIILPLQQIKTRYNGVETVNTGISDPSLYLGWHVFKRIGDYKVQQRLITGLGVKLPLGSYNATNEQARRFSLLTQVGTGSYDGFIYLNYMFRKKIVGMNVNSMIKLNGKNKYEERFATACNQVVSVFCFVEAGRLRIFPSVMASYEYSKGLYVNNHLVEGTNMNLLLIGPSCDLNYKNMVLNACYQFNVYERVSSQNLSTSGRIVIGLTFTFNQSKYLINS